MDLNIISEKIISSPLFLRLKNVVENNPYHDHESVYDHLLKTFEKAKQEINGDNITNQQAKAKYIEFLNQEIGGIKKRELLQILALIHDIGKMSLFEDDGKIQPTVAKFPDGTTKGPGHEYAGSVIAKQVLDNSGLTNEAIEYLAKGIRLHDSFNGYYQQNKLVSSGEFIGSMKQRSEGMHLEETFNALCDNYSALPFQEALALITDMFNDPTFYSERRYFIQ